MAAEGAFPGNASSSILLLTMFTGLQRNWTIEPCSGTAGSKCPI